MAGVIATAAAVDTFSDCVDCPLMVTVPAGSFMMGSTPEETDREGAKPESVKDERPRHSVSVRQFSLAMYEVTRDQFDGFVRATGHQAGGPCWIFDKAQLKFIESGANDWRNPGFSQVGDDPVVCVNWNDAKAYVRWLSQKSGKIYRLPSEAEWEYAARAGTTTSRYWGDSLGEAACRSANVADSTFAGEFKLNPATMFQCRDGYAYTSPVYPPLQGGARQFNAFGLMDMMGNVWEWTEDCYNTSYNGAPTNGSTWLTGDCTLRVLRGGSWILDPWGVRSAVRLRSVATNRVSIAGFRVARTD